MKLSSVLLALTVSALSACASKPQTTASTETETRTTLATSESADAMATGQSDEMSNAGGTALPHEDPNNPLCQQRSVYFDFDSDAIKEQYQSVIGSHARYLGQSPDQKITLQGHTDERGSREYNLALGQRRAEAVKRAMSVMGVKDSQISTVSYGEERPEATGQSETAWSQNRRVEIQYAGEE